MPVNLLERALIFVFFLAGNNTYIPAHWLIWCGIGISDSSSFPLMARIQQLQGQQQNEVKNYKRIQLQI
jgi:hypothetical protein